MVSLFTQSHSDNIAKTQNQNSEMPSLCLVTHWACFYGPWYRHGLHSNRDPNVLCLYVHVTKVSMCGPSWNANDLKEDYLIGLNKKRRNRFYQLGNM